MGRLEKFLLCIISLIGFGISLCILSLFYSIPFVSDETANYLMAFPWLIYIFAGFSAFTCFCFIIALLTALFFPDKSNSLTIIKDKGRLTFSKQTIESTVKYSFADLEGISFSSVKVKMQKQPEKTKIYVKLSLKNSMEVLELTETIQDKIESALKLSFGINVKYINIKVVELNTQEKITAKEDDEEIQKSSRVE